MSYITSIDTDDLTNPSSARKYDLGVRFVDFSSSDAIKPEYIYVKAPSGTLTQFQPYQVSVSNTVNAEVTVKVPTTTLSGATIVVPQVAVSSGNYCFVQYKGIATVLTTDTVAAGDYVEVINAGTGLLLDGGTTGNTVESEQSVGIAKTATDAGSASIVLSGNKVEVAAA
jgi:hypothetical protein